MERRSFVKKSTLLAGSALAAGSIKSANVSHVNKDIYELKVYRLSRGYGRDQLKKYYTNAVIPFLNETGTNVGAFDEYSMDEPPRIYILHAHQSFEAYHTVIREMQSNKTFLSAAKDYFELPADKPVFERYETFLLDAFDSIPHHKVPPKNRGLFELRTYESYNEDAGMRKIKMFNEEELPLFEEVGLHPFFFGKILAGQYMPALTYMLWFRDMDERETNWNKFRISEAWQKMRVKKEYADTVSKVHKKFLVPAEFSQL